MHISEGILPPAILAGGVVCSLIGCYIGLRKLDWDHILPVSMLAAVFFLASLIHVPIGPVSVHLVLNGLLGVLLGWASFPAIIVALILQALLFQYGGLLVLGVNALNMAVPPVLCYYLFRPLLQGSASMRSLGAIACGAFSVALSGLLTAGSLALAGQAFMPVAKAIFLAHLPIMAIEGLITMLIVNFLYRVRPELLQFSHNHFQNNH